MKPTQPNRVEATVEKLIAGGEGLVRLEGEVVLVPRVAAGERVALEIDRKRKPARGRVLKVLEPSSARVEPSCPRFDRCGGCDLMHLSPDAQRDARLGILREALGEPPITWHTATPAHGRTRARFHGKAVGGRVIVGFHGFGTNTIVDLDACPALDPRLAGAFDDARAILAGAPGSGEISAAVGEAEKPVLSIEWRAELPASVFGEAERRVKSGRIAGVEIRMAGASVPARVGDPRPQSKAADGLPVHAPPKGFAQASEIGDRVLVDLVLARANAEGKNVVELFAGSGNFTVALAKIASKLTAVEIDEAASTAARGNLALRGLAAKVVAADADAWPLPKGVDVVVLDPPRSGARGAAQAIGKVPRVVYVSCDPTTLARDLAVLRATHRIVSVDAVDLFPDTSHVETVVTLERAR